MTTSDRALKEEASASSQGDAGTATGSLDESIAHLVRIGRKLFGVTNCVINFGDAWQKRRDTDHSTVSAEEAFCSSAALSGQPVIVLDARNHRSYRQNQAVVGAPHIRFFASYPVFDQEKNFVGYVSLFDPAPRAVFGEDDKRAIADLAALVERELELRSANALQLDLQKKNKNLRRKSLIDPLIGTWNRGAIMRILTIEAARCDKIGAPLSLIVADLDYFKKINDSYGHPAGDAVLVKVASRLRSCIRPQEALGRYGGEEFLIVLPGASHATAMAVAERMRVAVASQPEAIGGVALNLTISAGVASTDLFPTATTEELISRADVALYAAKDAGRNRVVNAVPELS
jgi:diguanylate cyclase (GGDEF)-like protein